jgi:type 2 lantibiotic biosynthesis protein LanM
MQPPASYRSSLFLHERSIPADLPISEESLSAAERRARQWQESSGAGEAVFLYRLSAAGLDWDGFVRLLAAREAEAPVAIDESAYDGYRVIEEIRLGAHAGVVLPTVQWTSPDGTVGTEPPFGSFLRPFLQWGVGRLRDGLAALAAGQGDAPPLFEPRVEAQLMLHLTEILSKRCSGTLILELNVARLRGLLEGETSNERFRYFSERYFTPERVLALLEEYPVLARLLALGVCQWADAALEFLARLAPDRERPDMPVPLGTLRSLELGVSDPHRGGRSVVIAEDVQGHRIVYKPTSLAVDVQMQRLVRAVNEAGLRHPLRAVGLIDRGEYGWLEFIAARGCESVDELHRFYWRQGCWLALLHLVRGADFHHENLIACGEYPVLVDNEALFHQAVLGEAASGTAAEEAGAALRRSVLRQALLPFIFRLTAAGEGIDNSGLGGTSGQVARGSVRRWAEPGTDQMHVAEADLVTQEARNRPSLRGEPVDTAAFLADILQGFRETYDTLAARRDELHPLLDGFAGTRVRYLVRPTRTYTVFLREGYHPNDLRDGLDRDELLDRLWALTSLSPGVQRVIPYEHEDLRTGDVPAFFTRPDSTHLWSSGGRRIDDLFAGTTLQEAHRELDRVSEDERERQALLIRLAVSEARSRDRGPAPGSAPPAPAADLHAAAVRIGEVLKRRALAGERGVCWISLDPFVDDRPGGDKLRNVAVARDDLYHGAAGIALFLAYLGEATGDGEATALARGTLRAMLEAKATTGPTANPALGAYVGRASYSYALQHLAALWSEPALLDEALADLPAIEALIPADRELDLLAGSAGCAVVTLQLHAATGDPAALRVARACGDHLLRNAQPSRGGVSWTGGSFAGPVAGFAHGAAGIAWALLELASATGDERYREAALQGLAFERDLLSSPDGSPFQARVSWCHGLPSVALARILSAAALDDPRFRPEVEAGIDRLLGSGTPADACLCHGVLGNAEILALAGRHCGVEAWQRTAHAWAASAAGSVEALEREPLLPLHGRFAGLMCGLAGLGWGLLRFARWDTIPSVLTLQPPLAPGSRRA